jgi:hypothetical protein
MDGVDRGATRPSWLLLSRVWAVRGGTGKNRAIPDR